MSRGEEESRTRSPCLPYRTTREAIVRDMEASRRAAGAMLHTMSQVTIPSSIILKVRMRAR